VVGQSRHGTANRTEDDTVAETYLTQGGTYPPARMTWARREKKARSERGP
jgi:hypothetical protein